MTSKYIAIIILLFILVLRYQCSNAQQEQNLNDSELNGHWHSVWKIKNHYITLDIKDNMFIINKNHMFTPHYFEGKIYQETNMDYCLKEFGEKSILKLSNDTLYRQSEFNSKWTTKYVKVENTIEDFKKDLFSGLVIEFDMPETDTSYVSNVFNNETYEFLIGQLKEGYTLPDSYILFLDNDTKIYISASFGLPMHRYQIVNCINSTLNASYKGIKANIIFFIDKKCLNQVGYHINPYLSLYDGQINIYIAYFNTETKKVTYKLVDHL